MEDKPICPLLTSNEVTWYCCGEECAWWNAECQRCSMVSLTDSVRKMVKK